MKDESGGNIINEFVRLKSQMYSMKNIDDKDSNIAKGVNIATEFNKFKDIVFNNKVLRHKMRRIQGKNINLENTESIKYRYSVLMIKNLFQMMGFIHLLIFIRSYKNRFTQMIIKIKRLLQIKKIKEYSHKKKRFSQMTTNKNKCVQINSQ